MAEKWEISDDGLVYTFHLRNNANWSNGEPVTAHDFLYSIRRLLDPLTASRYSYQAWYIVNAKKLHAGRQPIFRRATRSKWNLCRRRTCRTLFVANCCLESWFAANRCEEKKKDDLRGRNRVYVVDIDGKERRFQAAVENYPLKSGSERCRQVLLDFREVGFKAIDDHTLEIRLTNRTPYFLDLTAFHALSPVNQKCLETYGSPSWTQPDHIVTNGAYRMVRGGCGIGFDSSATKTIGMQDTCGSNRSTPFRSTIARRL